MKPSENPSHFGHSAIPKFDMLGIAYASGMNLPAGDRQLVQIMDAALAEATRRAGGWLACRPGCTQCCHGAFAINQLDTLRLRSGMDALRTSDPARAATVEERAKRWIEEYRGGFPGDPETGRIGESDEDRERFAEFADDAPCPALDAATGLCDLYEARPMTCRVFGPPVRVEGADGAEGLGHCELCFAGATAEQVAACEMAVPAEMEEALVAELDAQGARGETVVAFALLC